MKSAQRYIVIFATLFLITNSLVGQSNTNYIIKYSGTGNATIKTIGIFENTSGNVGINTTTPLSKLSINGGLAVGTYAGLNAAPSNGMIVSGNVGVGTLTPAYKLDVLGSVQTQSQFRVGMSGQTGVFSGTAYSADNIWLGFDADYSTGWISRAAGSNFAINKYTNKVFFNRNTGTAVGSTIPSWTSFMTMDLTNGNVGVGTTSPGAAEKLAINISGVNSGVRIGPTANDGSVALFVKAATASQNIVQFGSNDGQTTKAFIVDANGNVGIGTTSPRAKLHVKGDGFPNSFLFLESNLTGQDAGIRLLEAGTVRAHIYYNATNGLVNFLNSNADGIFLNASGNVGIGTTNPGTNKLAVYGTIKTKEVNVTSAASDWPDYVFDETYKLPALDNVEQLIKSEKHLSGIPSKEEVAKKGVKLGEMQSKLLRKVEELTLYVIEQNKRIEKLEKENQEMRK